MYLLYVYCLTFAFICFWSRESDADEIDIISVTPPTKFEAIKEEPTDAFPTNKNAKCCVHSAKEIRAIDEIANQVIFKLLRHTLLCVVPVISCFMFNTSW